MAYISAAMKNNPLAMKHVAESEVKGVQHRLRAYAFAAENYLTKKLTGFESEAEGFSVYMAVLKAHSDLLAQMIGVEQTIEQFYGTLTKQPVE